MEPVLLFLAEFWWLAPATVGAGAVGYGALTTNRRRARRLELDAARYEANQAYASLVAARAGVRSAHADLLSAKSQRTGPTPGTPSVAEARRQLADAKRRHRAAVEGVRAGRSRIKAARARMAITTNGELPITQVMTAHDAVTARWLAYETDAGKALSFPQMLDSGHPPTLAFLRAQREAQSLRPATAKAKISPEQYVAYRDAVRRAEATLDAAEHDAERAVRAWLPSWTAGASAAVAAQSGFTWTAAPAASATPEPSAPPEQPRPTQAPPRAPKDGRPVWPVPARSRGTGA